FLLVLVLGIAGLLNVDLKDDKLLDPQRPASFFLVLFLFLPFIVVPSLLIRYLHQVSWCQVLAFSVRFDWRLYFCVQPEPSSPRPRSCSPSTTRSTPAATGCCRAGLTTPRGSRWAWR